MRYELEILSPLHVGDGEQIFKDEIYIVEQGKNKHICLFDLVEMRSNLNNDQQIKMDAYWSDQILNDKRPDLTDFIVENNLISLITDLNSISFKIMSDALLTLKNIGKDGRKKESLEGIRTFIKTNKKPFIPGSEIKGAIRTALLYCELKNNKALFEKLIRDLSDIDTDLKNLLTQYRDAVQSKREFGTKLGRLKKQNKRNTTEYNIAHEEYFHFKKQAKNYKNQLPQKQKDVSNEIKKIYESLDKSVFFLGYKKDSMVSMMKNLLISDSSVVDPTNLSIAVEKITHKKTDTEGKLHKFLKEYLPKGLRAQLMMRVMEDRHALLCNANKDLSLGKIIKSCNDFSLAKAEEDLRFFSSASDFVARYIKAVSFYKQLIAKINQASDKNEIYLRIGAGQGLLSITIDLLIKNNNYPEDTKNVYKELIACLKENRAEPEGDYPASRRVVNLGNEYLPPGWICLREVKE